MPTIEHLSRTDVLRDTDLIPLFSPEQHDTRSATLPQIVAYVIAKTEGEPDETLYSLVTNANAVTVTALPSAPGASVWVQLASNALASSLTVILPGIDDRANDQEVLVTFTQVAQSVVIQAGDAQVLGAPNSLSANGFFRLRYDIISNTWFRVG